MVGSNSPGPQPSRQAVYVISVAAELTGCHPQTLRIYERKGLVSPSRTGGGSRLYSDADIAALTRITSLTSDGLTLAGVKRVLELEAQVAQLQSQLTHLEAEASNALKAAKREHRRDLVPLSQEITLYRKRR